MHMYACTQGAHVRPTRLLNDPPPALEPKVLRPLQLVLDGGVEAAAAGSCREGARVVEHQAQRHGGLRGGKGPDPWVSLTALNTDVI